MDADENNGMELAAVIEPSRVLCNVEARSKKHSLDIISELLATAVPDLSQGTVFDSLIQREKVGSTALERGVAIPHGCMEGIDRVYAAFVKLSAAVDYDTADGQPVDLLCGLLLPADEELACGQQLQEVARRFRESDFLDMLRSANSSRVLYETLTGSQSEPEARSASG